jgi:hypothetical protein
MDLLKYSFFVHKSADTTARPLKSRTYEHAGVNMFCVQQISFASKAGGAKDEPPALAESASLNSSVYGGRLCQKLRQFLSQSLRCAAMGQRKFS